MNEFVDEQISRTSLSAHLLALEKARAIGFARYLVSATTPFSCDDLQELRNECAGGCEAVCVPSHEQAYARRGWSMFPGIDRICVNERARIELGWRPQYDFARIIDHLLKGRTPAVRWHEWSA